MRRTCSTSRRYQVKQAETQRTAADGVVTARLPETYQWLLVPTQANPQSPVTWQTIRLAGQDALAERASKKLRNEELLVVNFAASRLRMELDRVPLWRGDHVSIRQLVEDFGRYLYLPRLQTPDVLVDAIRSGLALLTWEQDAFAYAESYDESAARYRGLRHSTHVSLTRDDASLLVKPEAARKQIEQETAPPRPHWRRHRPWNHRQTRRATGGPPTAPPGPLSTAQAKTLPRHRGA